MAVVTSGNASSGGLGAETAAPSDADLLRAHVDGDPQAFAELVRRHRDRLWAVALRTIGDREEAADAVQDALLAAHRNAARFRGESAVTTWLHRIVVNACLDRIRRRQSHPTVPLPDGNRAGDRPTGVEPAAPIQDHDTALVVREALAALPPDQRAAIVLVDVQGYPVAEAAEILGVAEGTIKSRCARGRARMAIALGHLRVSPPAGPKASGPPVGLKASDRPAGPKASDRPRPRASDRPAGPKASDAPPGLNAGDPPAGSETGSSHRRPEGGSASAGPNSSSALGQPLGQPGAGIASAAHETGTAPAGHEGDSAPAGHEGDSAPAAHETDSAPAAHESDSAPAGHEGGSGPGRSEADGDSAQPVEDGAPARARDTGHEADGNRGGAGSVPSGPAAASGTRPSAHDRRDHR